MWFELRAFYHWMMQRGTKVLTERCVIGTILEVHQGYIRAKQCGVNVDNAYGSWYSAVQGLAGELRDEAHEQGGKFVSVILDGYGQDLQVQDMAQNLEEPSIDRLLIVLGGPEGIPPRSLSQLKRLLNDYTDCPIISCTL